LRIRFDAKQLVADGRSPDRSWTPRQFRIFHCDCL